MSSSEWILRLLMLGVCFMGGAFFAGMETGIISINRLRLHHLVLRGLKPASVIERFLQNPERLLSTTLVGTNLCYSVFAIVLTSLLLRTGLPGAPVVAHVSSTILLLVFCEYLPKAWFQALPLTRTLPFAWVLEGFARLFRPIGRTVAGLVDALLGSTVEGQPVQPLLTREDLIHLTAESGRSGALSPFESRMIRGVFDLSGIRCRDIMVPADRIVRVDAGLSAGELTALAHQTELNRFPVWDAGRNRYIGIVHIFDALSDPEPAGKTVKDYMRPPQFIEEHMLVDHILPRMRATRQPMTLVVGSDGAVAGLITINNVLRVIVGQEPTPVPAPAAPAAARPA
jgi:putative hemolysin